MNKRPLIEIERHVFDDGRAYIEINAGPRGHEHIVPPAGENFAFDVPKWERRVSVSVSATGRSVRVYVDGKEVEKMTDLTSDAREHNAWKPGDGAPKHKLCNCAHVPPYATTGTCCGRGGTTWCCCGAVTSKADCDD